MSFQYVAINDGCMAGLELNRNTVAGFELGKIAIILRDNSKAGVFQVFTPAAATTSARGLVYFDQRWLSLLICHRWWCYEAEQTEGQKNNQ